MRIRSITSYLLSRIALVCAVSGLAFGPRLSAANPPGTTFLETIDLLPGADAYFPFRIAINHLTHKLYTPGAATGATSGTSGMNDAGPGNNYGVKVIDTTTNQVVAGIDLGRYDEGAGNEPAFKPLWIAVDGTAAPLGNRIYVVGSVGDDRLFLRVIDGATDTNLTDQSTDLLLPVTGPSFGGMDVNPVNHKVYVTVSNHVVVIDGPSLQVLATVNGFLTVGLPTADPVTNKVFLFGLNTLQILDSATDTIGPFRIVDYNVRAAAYDSTSGQVFVVGGQSAVDAQLYLLDGTSGAQLNSQPALPLGTQAITVDGGAGLVYVAQPTSFSEAFAGEVAAFDTGDLSARGTFPYGGGELDMDGTGSSKRLYLLDFSTASRQGPELQNMVGVLNPADASLERVAVASSPGQIAVNPRTNRIYIADEESPQLTVLDGTSRMVLARIATAPADNTDFDAYPITRPLGVSVELNRLYLSRTMSTSRDELGTTAIIDVYEGATFTLIDSITVSTADETRPPQIAVDDTRRRLYASASAGSFPATTTFSVQVYDLDSNALIASIATPAASGFINGIGVNPVTGLAYVSGSTNSSIQIIDPVTDTIIDTAQAGAIPGPIAVNAKDNRIFVANVGFVDNSATVVDGVTGDTVATISNTGDETTDGVTCVAVDDLTNTLYVADDARTNPDDGSIIHGRGRVTVFDGNSDYASLGELEVGQYPSWAAFNTKTRQLFVSNNLDGTVSVLENSTAAPPDRLANISTRLDVLTGDDVLIGGFIVTGPAGSTKEVLVRGLGPSLTALGVSGALADPMLELHSGADVLATNDNWKIDKDGQSQEAAIEATALQPTNDLESAILLQLAPGSYTAILHGVDNGTGVGLVEIYDLTESDTIKMVNISSRGRVETGDDVMIGGLIVSGGNPSQVMVRAIAPSLTAAGVADALQDPVLELYDPQGVLITANDNWKDTNEAEIEATMLSPTDDRESAILATLYPANYTAIVRGKDNTTGVGLVEVYYLQ